MMKNNCFVKYTFLLISITFFTTFVLKGAEEEHPEGGKKFYLKNNTANYALRFHPEWFESEGCPRGLCPPQQVKVLQPKDGQILSFNGNFGRPDTRFYVYPTNKSTGIENKESFSVDIKANPGGTLGENLPIDCKPGDEDCKIFTKQKGIYYEVEWNNDGWLVTFSEKEI